MMTTVSLQIVGIIEPLIQHADWFFPGGGLGTMMCWDGAGWNGMRWDAVIWNGMDGMVWDVVG